MVLDIVLITIIVFGGNTSMTYVNAHSMDDMANCRHAAVRVQGRVEQIAKEIKAEGEGAALPRVVALCRELQIEDPEVMFLSAADK